MEASNLMALLAARSVGKDPSTRRILLGGDSVVVKPNDKGCESYSTE